jgi:hypothetical protein
LNGPEAAEFRVFLEESELMPTAAASSTAQEGPATLEARDYLCHAESGGDVVVLTASWQTPAGVLRARLQFPLGLPKDEAAELDAVRASMRYQGYTTLGFGDFHLSDVGPPPNSGAWLSLAPSPKPWPAKAPLAAPPETAPNVRAVSLGGDKVDIGRVVQDYRGSLVFIEGGGGAGSGFLCQMPDGLYLLTNQHVASEMPAMRLVTMAGTKVTIGAGSAAVGHDIIRFAIPGAEHPLVASENVELDAKIGDAILVLGNSEGARVVQPLAGKLVGIGPDRIEVTAEFVPGNSGSPIVHVPTGKVIGIATYLTKRRFKELTNPNEAAVRRFGYRLDTVKRWQPVNWPAYQAEKAAVDRVEALTQDLARLIKELGSNRPLNASAYGASPIGRPVRDFATATEKKGLSPVDRNMAVQNFLASIRAATQSDIVQARQALRYDFFLHEISEQADIREQMYKLFDHLARTNAR